MGDHWNFFPCAMGEDQAFIFVNVDVKERIAEAPRSLARIRLKYKQPNAHGLPTNEEFEPVKAVEDRLQEFAGNSDDWYVGRVTVAGHRYFHIYTSVDIDIWQSFLDRLANSTGYELDLFVKDDPGHLGYLEDLYPTEDDWQLIKDADVIESLENHGDDGSLSRRVDHWAYFDDAVSAKKFLQWALTDRFTESQEHAQPEDGKFCVRLYHHGTMDLASISNHTISLRRKAAEFGGEYDGWEAPVLKGDR